jgi:glucose-1-phosphate thymidylyltransferase
MKCVLLAAGYATRLYPLTENTPKALLKLGKKTILDMVVDKIEEVKEIDQIYIVTNHKFYISFSDWAQNHGGNIKVLNDFTTSNDNRLGAIGDLKYVIDKESIDDELLVMASDNIFDFSLDEMVKLYREKNADVICVNKVESESEIKQMGVAQIAEDGKVIGFEEKPENPKSDLGAAPFYLYHRDTVRMIEEYLKEGNNPDAPGNFIPWLAKKKPVYAYVTEKMRIDIGTPETYEAAQKLFS